MRVLCLIPRQDSRPRLTLKVECSTGPRQHERAHWEVLVSVDFTTSEVWRRDRLVTCYLLFVMELATRRVHFARCTANPDEEWMLQVARNLTDAEAGFLRGKRYLLMDHDTKFSESFRAILEQADCRRSAVTAPFAEPDATF